MKYAPESPVPGSDWREVPQVPGQQLGVHESRGELQKLENLVLSRTTTKPDDIPSVASLGIVAASMK